MEDGHDLISVQKTLLEEKSYGFIDLLENSDFKKDGHILPEYQKRLLWGI